MSDVLQQQVLVLNRYWQPVQTCSGRRALGLLAMGHAQALQTRGEECYQTHDFESWVAHTSDAMQGQNALDRVQLVHTVRLTLMMPHVIVLSLFNRLPRKKVKLTRQNVFIRDQYVCQYCHRYFPEKELNLDHVIPRDRKGKTTWENIVTSCVPCNTRKANKLPHEVNMRLLKQPKKPHWQPHYGMVSVRNIPESWVQFLEPSRAKVSVTS